jgi:hypothetical protein
MSRRYQFIFPFFLVGAVCSPAIFPGGAVRASYRVYDPGYEDSHTWDRDEVVYYQRWEGETHRDHPDFQKRSGHEQKEYWTCHTHSGEKH